MPSRGTSASRARRPVTRPVSGQRKCSTWWRSTVAATGEWPLTVWTPRDLDRLRETGCPVVDGREVAERARRIKTPEEVDALRDAVAVCQTGIARMMEATRSGMTENAIRSVLHETNIRLGGEWIETRLFSSGPRTNLWYQEASNRRVEAGDMVSLDSDLVGPMGYSADISRSWIVDGKPPSGEQRTLYGLAFEQVMRNQELFRPGTTFGEIAGRAFALPGGSRSTRYRLSPTASASSTSTRSSSMPPATGREDTRAWSRRAWSSASKATPASPGEGGRQARTAGSGERGRHRAPLRHAVRDGAAVGRHSRTQQWLERQGETLHRRHCDHKRHSGGDRQGCPCPTGVSAAREHLLQAADHWPRPLSDLLFGNAA